MKNKVEIISLSGLDIELHRKKMKHIRLRVISNHSLVRLSAPKHVSLEFLYEFARSKLEWIRERLALVAKRTTKMPLAYATGDSILYAGKSYTLIVVEAGSRAKVEIVSSSEKVSQADDEGGQKSDKIILTLPKNSTREKRAKIIESWYRIELKAKIALLIDKWEPIMKVNVAEYGVKKMRTRWGTCSIRARRIWLALALVTHTPEHLEYVVVHEMTHLLERSHGPRFQAFMTEFLPDWRKLKKELNKGGIIEG